LDRFQCDALVAELRRYRDGASATQQSQADRVVEFIRSCEAPWRRSTLQGHLTASAWIVDAAFESALLIHHKKLGKWLQPGGHVDDEDSTFFDAALREAREETGLDDLAPLKPHRRASLVDVDVHAIPARADEPAHFHYDLRFGFVANRSERVAMNENESSDLARFQLAVIAGDSRFDSSVARMAELTCSARFSAL
jgi:8-oxo-dGTP pyrophosphatase MutT (NUDIX family)